jgi:carboxyl-terminal processing protease
LVHLTITKSSANGENMNRRNFLPVIILGLFVPWAVKSFGRSQSKEWAGLLEQSWNVVNDKYYDNYFHGLNWRQIYEKQRSSKYTSVTEAYAAIRSMLKQLKDPAIRLLSPEQVAAFTSELSGRSYSGIGLPELLSIDTDSRTGLITIVTPLLDTPAARAGLQPGDVIVAVDGVNTSDLELAEVTMKLRGQSKTSVRLMLMRANQKFNVTIQRETIQSLTVQSLMKSAGSQKIGYISFAQFLPSVVSEIQKAIEDLSRQGADSLVLDLRNNPGGDVATGQKIAGMFLGKTAIATIRGRNGEITRMMGTSDKITTKPLVVLVNRGTASFAEVLASALQENRRAKIVGGKTFGKSLMQSLSYLADKSALVVPVGQIYTLKGTKILDNGIIPDVIVNQQLSSVSTRTSISLLKSSVIARTSLQDLQFQKAIKNNIS